MKNIKIIDLEQRSFEWFEWRRGKASASRAPVVMNDVPTWYPVKTWDDLRLQDADLAKKADAFTERAWEYGRKYEPQAVESLRIEYNINPIKGGCCELISDPRFTASYDLIDEDLSKIIEVKCPISQERSLLYRALIRYGDIINNQAHIELGMTDPWVEEYDSKINVKDYLPPYIWWQLVHLAGMLIDEEIDNGFAVLGVYTQNGAVSIMIPYKDLWCDWSKLKYTWELYLENTPPSNSDVGFTAKVWAEAKKHLEYHVDEERRSRDDLLLLLDGDEYAGVEATVKKASRKGTVDWKAIAMHITDLVYKNEIKFTKEYLDKIIDQHTKPASSYWRCTRKGK